jgi:p-hydroxybenzoate 3-monooxygenase
MPRTTVGIVGAGPTGLFGSHIRSISRASNLRYWKAAVANILELRVRAGVLEHGSVKLLIELGVRDSSHP